MMHWELKERQQGYIDYTQKGEKSGEVKMLWCHEDKPQTRLGKHHLNLPVLSFVPTNSSDSAAENVCKETEMMWKSMNREQFN